MAGGVFTPSGDYWGVGSSVFNWTVEALAQEARDPVLKSRLQEIFDFNLGGFGIEDFPEGTQAELVALIRRLPELVRSRFPLLEDRDVVIAQIDELAAMFAAEGTASTDGSESPS